MSKLHSLLTEYDMDRDDFLEEYALNEVVPGICMNVLCDNTEEYEPDQDRGWCSRCRTQSVKSGLILLGVI